MYRYHILTMCILSIQHFVNYAFIKLAKRELRLGGVGGLVQGHPANLLTSKCLPFPLTLCKQFLSFASGVTYHNIQMPGPRPVDPDSRDLEWEPGT